MMQTIQSKYALEAVNVTFHRSDIYLMEKIKERTVSAVIGEKAPNFGVSEWVQGAPTNFEQEKDHIVLLEVFQVNCPGCFMNAIPEAINIYNKYKDDGVRVLGLATAFEDFDKNTLGNLKMLAETGESGRRDKIGTFIIWSIARRQQTVI